MELEQLQSAFMPWSQISSRFRRHSLSHFSYLAACVRCFHLLDVAEHLQEAHLCYAWYVLYLLLEGSYLILPQYLFFVSVLVLFETGIGISAFVFRGAPLKSFASALWRLLLRNNPNGLCALEQAVRVIIISDQLNDIRHKLGTHMYY